MSTTPPDPSSPRSSPPPDDALRESTERRAGADATGTATSRSQRGKTSARPQDSGRRWIARWSSRIAIVVGALLCFHVLLTAWLLPLAIRHWIVPTVSDRIDGTLEVGTVRFHPFRLSLRIDDVLLRDGDGEIAFTMQRFRGTFALWRSIREAGVHFEQVIVNRPHVRATRDGEAVLNFRRIFVGDPSQTPPPLETDPIRRIPHLVVDEVAVKDGTFSWRDESVPEPFDVELHGINFVLDDLDTDPTNDNDFLIVARSDSGASLHWRATFFADPFSSHGDITLADVPLETLMPYAMRHTDALVTSGTLTVELGYDFAPARVDRTALLDLRTVRLDGFRAEREGRSILDLPRTRLEDILTDADARSLNVGRVVVEGGSLHVERDREGVLNLFRMLTLAPDGDGTPEADAAPEGSPSDGRLPESEADAQQRAAIEAIEYPVRQFIAGVSYLLEDVVGPWTVDVETIEISNQSIDLIDHTTIEPVRMELRDVHLVAGPVRSADNYRIPFATEVRLEHGGAASINGVLGAGDGDIDVLVVVQRLDLGPIGPYAWGILPAPLDGARLRGGVVDADGRLRGSWSGTTDLRAAWDGEALAGEIRVSDEGDGEMIVAVAIAVDGLAEAGYSAADGGDASFEGSLVLDHTEGGASLLAELGFGDDGTARFDRLSYVGSAATQLPQGGGAASLRAKGRIEGVGLATATPSCLLLSASLGALAGDIELEGSLDRLADATLVGSATFDDLGVDAALGESTAPPLDASLRAERIAVDGSAALRTADDGTRAVDVVGRLDGEAISTSLDDRRAAAASASLDGRSTLTMIEDVLRLVAEGTASVSGVEADDGDMAAIAAALRATGTADAMLAERMSVRLEGDVGSQGRAEVRVGAHRAGADALAAKGLLILGDDALDAVPETLAAHDRGDDIPRWRVLARGELTGSAISGESGAGTDSAAAQSIRAAGDAIGSLDDDGGWSAAAVGTLTAEQATLRDNAGRNVGVESSQLDGEAHVGGGAGAPTAATARGDAVFRGVAGEHIGESIERVAGGEIALSGTAELAPDGRLEATGQVKVERASARLVDDASTTTATVATMHAGGTVALPPSADDADRTSIEASGTFELEGIEGTQATSAGVDPTMVAAIDRVSGDGAAEFTAADDTAPDGDFGLRVSTTATTIEGVRFSAPGPSDASMTVASVRLDGVALDHAAGTIIADAITVNEPNVTATVGLVPQGTEESAPRRRAADVAEELPYRIQLGSFTLAAGRVELFDATDPTGATMLVEELVVNASNLGTDGDTVATVNASSRVQGTGRFGVEGTADPFRTLPEGDFVVTITGVPLPPFSAVAGALAGWRIEQGRLTASIPIQVTAGKVRGELDFTLDGVRLGERVQSPRAPSVPLDLGLALLRDRNDRVAGRVPFSGDMTDPQFSFGGIILQAFFGLIGQVVTAPFQLLASAFGGGEADVATIPFEAGLAEPTEEGAGRIGIVGRALEDRPALSLELFGHYATGPDGDALRPGLLRDEVLRRVQTSFPSLTEVGDGLYRQIVISIHVERLGPPPASFEEAEAAVLRTVEVPLELLQDLARRRAEVAVEALSEQYGIDPARLTATVPAPEAMEKADPHVHLELF